MSDASEEAHLSTAAHYVGEREKLSNLNERYEEEIQYLRHRLSSHDRSGRRAFYRNVFIGTVVVILFHLDVSQFSVCCVRDTCSVPR